MLRSRRRPYWEVRKSLGQQIQCALNFAARVPIARAQTSLDAPLVHFARIFNSTEFLQRLPTVKIRSHVIRIHGHELLILMNSVVQLPAVGVGLRQTITDETVFGVLLEKRF